MSFKQTYWWKCQACRLVFPVGRSQPPRRCSICHKKHGQFSLINVGVKMRAKP